jgi:hypothetical protein
MPTVTADGKAREIAEEQRRQAAAGQAAVMGWSSQQR